MTPQQAAAFLGLDDKTITRWARKHYLPAHPMGEGKKKYWRFFEHELLAWLLSQSDRAVAA
jgi:excisionase family DNA binding protein